VKCQGNKLRGTHGHSIKDNRETDLACRWVKVKTVEVLRDNMWWRAFVDAVINYRLL